MKNLTSPEQVESPPRAHQPAVKIIPIDHKTTVTDLCRALNHELRELFDESDFGLVNWQTPGAGDRTWNEYREGYPWLAVYAVQGTEGYWVHVDLVSYRGAIDVARSDLGKALGVFQCKTFHGLTHALKIANLARYCLEDA